MRHFFAIGVALCLGACATVTRGSTDQVTFSSEPSGAEVRTSVGYTCSATPCTFQFDRKSEFIATFSMEGYEDQQIPVQTRVAGNGAAGFAGNILLGGIVGMGVDVATGATLEHFPNPVYASLVPTVLSKKRVPARKRPVPVSPRAEPEQPMS
jgi:hypothetical protein